MSKAKQRHLLETARKRFGKARIQKEEKEEHFGATEDLQQSS